jgi:hypothetical protein
MNISKGRKYGKYYIAEISIFNNTGQTIHFIPEHSIRAIYINQGIVEQATILSYDEYNKKVKTAQGWAAFAVAFSQGYSASQAGYSSSSTTGSANIYGTSNSNTNIYGSNGGWANINTNTYGSANIYGSSFTQSYDGGAAYAAQQNASRNIHNFTAHQQQQKTKIQFEYLKRHSLRNQEEISGKINIKHQDADIVEISILFNGKEYTFPWEQSLIQKLEK